MRGNCQTINLKLGSTEINKDQKKEIEKKREQEKEEDQSSVRDDKYLTFFFQLFKWLLFSIYFV